MPHFHVLNKVTRERGLKNILLKNPILFWVGISGLLGFILPLVSLTYEDYRHGIMIGEALSDFHHYLSSIISCLLMLIASYLISVRILKGVKLELENFEIKERFRMIIEQSPAVYELYDLEGLQIEVNKAYEDMWQFPEGRERTVRKFNVLESQEVVNTGLMKYVTKAYNNPQ